MQNMQNTFSIDFRQNDALREAFAGKKVGDRIKFEVDGNVVSLTNDGLTGSIKVIAPEGYEPPPEPSADETKAGIEPDTTSPVAVLIRSQGKAAA
jgi:hypothetical protein